MVDDADTTGCPADEADIQARTHARTDRQSAGRSVETTPESLYLWRIAVLEARVETLRNHVEHKEQDLQHVIDHYEGVLQERHARDGELLTDGGNSMPRDPTGASSSDDALTRAVDRVRSLIE
jgi:hypothetical protein